MMIELEEQYFTVSGCEVRIYAVDVCEEGGVHGAVFEPNGHWNQCSWSKIGATKNFQKLEHDLDLTTCAPKGYTARLCGLRLQELRAEEISLGSIMFALDSLSKRTSTRHRKSLQLPLAKLGEVSSLLGAIERKMERELS